jgi:hypothetical protein
MPVLTELVVCCVIVAINMSLLTELVLGTAKRSNVSGVPLAVPICVNLQLAGHSFSDGWSICGSSFFVLFCGHLVFSAEERIPLGAYLNIRTLDIKRQRGRVFPVRPQTEMSKVKRHVPLISRLQRTRALRQQISHLLPSASSKKTA